MVHRSFDLEISLWKIGSVDCKWSKLDAPGSYALCCHPLDLDELPVASIEIPGNVG